MPIVSKRGERMTQSPIRSLIPYAREAKSRGVDVIHLNIGQPDIKTPQAAIDRLKGYDNEIIEYGSSEGDLNLRKVAHNIIASTCQKSICQISMSLQVHQKPSCSPCFLALMRTRRLSSQNHFTLTILALPIRQVSI